MQEAASDSDAAETHGENGFGRVFILKFPLATAAGKADVLTAWIILHEEDFPRMTTCYIP